MNIIARVAGFSAGSRISPVSIIAHPESFAGWFSHLPARPGSGRTAGRSGLWATGARELAVIEHHFNRQSGVSVGGGSPEF